MSNEEIEAMVKKADLVNSKYKESEMIIEINNCINERLYIKICVQDGNGKLDYTEFGQMLLALDVIPL